MKQILIFVFTLLIISSCKKDKLEGENKVFLGTWNWLYTSHSYGWCDGDSFNETLTPDSDGNNYSIEFLEKGILKYYTNGKYLEKDRIVFSEFSGGECDYLSESFSFAINLNNDTEITGAFNGCINNDTIILTVGFPYEVFQEGCESYVSYFARE